MLLGESRSSFAMSTPTTLPSVTSLSTLPPPTQAATLDLLFEPSPALHSLTLPILQSASFSSYSSLISSVHDLLITLSNSASPDDIQTLDSILSSHPRLGAKKVDSAQSAAEQAKLQQGGEEEKRELEKLNAEYEEKFDGLRYVVFVNGRGRPEIMQDMQKRISEGTKEGERRAAIQVSEMLTS